MHLIGVNKLSILSNNLKFLRKRFDLSQHDIAARYGYKSFTTIQKWEDGTSEPSISTLKDLADLYCLSMEALLNFDLTSGYYDELINEDILPEIHSRPEIKSLLHLASKATKEDIELINAILEKIIK